jgi:hypothetical protein
MSEQLQLHLIALLSASRGEWCTLESLCHTSLNAFQALR